MNNILKISNYEFKTELEEIIDELNNILKQFETERIDNSKLELLEKNYRIWQVRSREFLKYSFGGVQNESYKKISGIKLNFDSMRELSKGVNPLDLNHRKKYFTFPIKKDLEVLEKLHSTANYIDSEILLQTNKEDSMSSQLKDTNIVDKIFISHASKDKNLVEKVIELVEAVGVKSSQIFCSSFEGYGIELGEDFLKRIKEEIDANSLVIFILSENYYASVISICEMGATWIKTSQHIPILIPPFDYSDVKGVIPLTQGMKINEVEKYNSLKNKLQKLFNLESIDSSIWERKRGKIIDGINELLFKKENTNEEDLIERSDVKPKNTSDYYDKFAQIIIANCKKKWPEEYDMQLHCINKQKLAIEKLRSNKTSDIPEDVFDDIREGARRKWPEEFDMQLHAENKQLDSYRKLNS